MYLVRAMSEYFFKVKIPEFYDLIVGDMAESLAIRLNLYKSCMIGVYVNVYTDRLIFAFDNEEARNRIYDFLKNTMDFKTLRYATIADLPNSKEVN